MCFFFQAEDGIRDLVRSRGLGDVYKRQAKGLEFPIVFMVGMEDGLLPHARSLEDPEEMEEERRLAYVGITRAKERLYLTHAFRRTRWGSDDVSPPSRFLQDIPGKLMEGRSLRARTDAARASARAATTWGRRAGEDDAPTIGRGDRARSAPAGSTVWSPARAAPAAAPSTRSDQAARPSGSPRFQTGDPDNHRPVGQSPLPHLRENVEIEEVHPAQYQQHQPDFRTKRFHGFLGTGCCDPVFQGQRYEADIDEVKPDHQQVVDGIRELFVAEKAVHEKNTAALMERTCHPDGKRDADGQLGDIGEDYPIHGIPFITNL